MTNLVINGPLFIPSQSLDDQYSFLPLTILDVPAYCYLLTVTCLLLSAY